MNLNDQRERNDTCCPLIPFRKCGMTMIISSSTRAISTVTKTPGVCPWHGEQARPLSLLVATPSVCFLFVYLLAVLWIKPRAAHTLDECFTPELCRSCVSCLLGCFINPGWLELVTYYRDVFRLLAILLSQPLNC